MGQEKTTDCRIIRVVEMPLTKKPDVPKEPRIALLNICLKDPIPQQRPVVEVVRNGQKTFREFEVLKVFADRAEAEKYASENGLTDAVYDEGADELGRIDADLTEAFQMAMRGEISDETLKKRAEFKRKLKAALKDPLTFENPLDRLSNELSIVASPDRRLKFYSWDRRTGGTMHQMTVIAQYRRKDGAIGVEELNDPNLDELPGETNFIIREIYEINVKGRTQYLTFGWGTPGGGAQFDLVQIFRLGDFGLVEDDSALPEKSKLFIVYPRPDRAELRFNAAKNEILYREFRADEDSGVMKATGRTIVLKLVRGRFVRKK